MRVMCVSITAILIFLLFDTGESSAGVNAATEVALSATVVQGDTIECSVTLSSAVKTRVVDLMFQIPDGLEYLSWEQGDFIDNPLVIGPTYHEPTGRLLVALAVRGKQAATVSSGEIGTLRLLRTGAEDTDIRLLEAFLADDQHRKDSLIAPGSILKSAAPSGTATPFPVRFALYTPRPNPVNPGTMISYEIPRPGARTSIKIYNVQGRLVRTLVDAHTSPGYYSVPWDLRNDTGHPVAPGVYFCRMEAGDFRETTKMVVLE